jgi:hypothetical protein
MCILVCEQRYFKAVRTVKLNCTFCAFVHITNIRYNKDNRLNLLRCIEQPFESALQVLLYSLAFLCVCVCVFWGITDFKDKQ